MRKERVLECRIIELERHNKDLSKRLRKVQANLEAYIFENQRLKSELKLMKKDVSDIK